MELVTDRRWTVGDLRAAMRSFDDSALVVVNVPTTDTYGMPDGWLPFQVDGIAHKWEPEGGHAALELETSRAWPGVLLFVSTADPDEPGFTRRP